MRPFPTCLNMNAAVQIPSSASFSEGDALIIDCSNLFCIFFQVWQTYYSALLTQET